MCDGENAGNRANAVYKKKLNVHITRTQEAETHTTIFKLQQVLSNLKTYKIAIQCFEI